MAVNYNSVVRNETGFITLPVASGATMVKNTRVAIASDGTVNVAAINVHGQGVVDSLNGGSVPSVVVRLDNAPGTQFGVAAANTTINVADAIYAATGGLVTSSATNSTQVGIALTAVTSNAAGVTLSYIPYGG